MMVTQIEHPQSGGQHAGIELLVLNVVVERTVPREKVQHHRPSGSTLSSREYGHIVRRSTRRDEGSTPRSKGFATITRLRQMRAGGKAPGCNGWWGRKSALVCLMLRCVRSTACQREALQGRGQHTGRQWVRVVSRTR